MPSADGAIMRITTSLLVAFAFCASGAPRQVAFEATGLIRHESFRNNLVTSAAERHFKIRVKDGRSFITTKFGRTEFFDKNLERRIAKANAEGAARTGFTGEDIAFEWSCDGHDNYLLTVLGNREACAGAEIRGGIVPCDDGVSLVAPVWLALGSFQYFATNQNGLTPFWRLNGSEELWFKSGSEFKINVDRSFEEPRILLQLSAFNTGFSYSNSGFGYFTKLVRNPLPPPFDHGYLLIDYKVIATTNYDGLLLPQQFIMTQYQPAEKATTARQLWKRYSYEGTL
jgi:hypothetical protein